MTTDQYFKLYDSMRVVIYTATDFPTARFMTYKIHTFPTLYKLSYCWRSNNTLFSFI